MICGLQKLTLLDYPEKMAAIIFLKGCNFLCPFCHNRDLVLSGGDAVEITRDEVFNFLNKRKGILDGVVISGGEPLIGDEYLSLIKDIKEMGYLVKLDTNGSFPEKLKELIDLKLCDYVAMDIKNSREKYAMTTGRRNLDISSIEQSVEILKSSSIPFEFRTTVTKELHSSDDFHKIGSWLKGNIHYFLQPYKDSDGVIMKGLSAPESADLAEYKAILSQYLSHVEIRGE